MQETANQELARRYGVALRKGRGGRIVPFGWSEQNGGAFVECQLPAEASTLLDAALAELSHSKTAP
jgi:hypothetical protein